MSDLPDLDIEPRRPNLKALRRPGDDAETERHAKRLVGGWLGDGKPELASLRVEIPKYVDRSLAVAAAERGVTKQYLVLEALQAKGYPVEDRDLIEDKRKTRRR